MPPATTTTTRVSRRLTGRLRRQPDPIPPDLRARLATERGAAAQFSLIAEHLRPELVRVAASCGVGWSAEDVASDVIARRYRRVVEDPPVTFATAGAYQHLRAGLIVSVRNASMNWHRDNRRTIVVDDTALAVLAGPGAHTTADELFDEADVTALQDALSRLDPVQAEVARLVGLEARSIREVSDRLGLPKSTVADAWGRVQATLRGSVERYLAGGYCQDVAPHLALLDAQRRAEQAGRPDRPLDDAIGEALAVDVARHVYGDPEEAVGGCSACRRARAWERTALGVFLPPPHDTTQNVFGHLRDGVIGAWDATFGQISRLIDDAWAGLVGPGGVAAGLGGAKVAVLITAVSATVSVPTVVPDLAERSRVARPIVAKVTQPTPPAAIRLPPAKATARTATSPTTAATGRSTPQVGGSSPVRSSGRGSSRSNGAVNEFTPGP